MCAQVTPWNYPMVMAVWKFAPAIAAGNTVVLKPSDTTPVTTLLLAEIAAEFLPPGVLNVVCGDRDTGRALVAAPDAAAGLDHRLDPGRHGGRRGGRRRPQAGPPRAGRQGAGRGLRRRRHRGGRRRHRRRRLLQRRPGLHGGDPGAGAASGSPTDFTAALAEAAAKHPGRRAGRHRGVLRAGQQRRASWPGCTASWTATPDHAEVRHRRPPDRRPRLLPRADRRGRTAASATR